MNVRRKDHTDGIIPHPRNPSNPRSIIFDNRTGHEEAQETQNQTPFAPFVPRAVGMGVTVLAGAGVPRSPSALGGKERGYRPGGRCSGWVNSRH
jgi:hypothetical protein